MKFYNYYKGAQKQKYFFWSVIVLLTSLFAIYPDYRSVNARDPLELIFGLNLVSHFIFYTLYFLPMAIAFWMRTDFLFGIWKKIAILNQWTFGIVGILFLVLFLYEAWSNKAFIDLAYSSFAIALMMTCLESVKKIKTLEFEDFK